MTKQRWCNGGAPTDSHATFIILIIELMPPTLRLVQGPHASQNSAVRLLAEVLGVSLPYEGVVSTTSQLRPLLLVNGAEIATTFAISKYLAAQAGHSLGKDAMGVLSFATETAFKAVQSISRDDVRDVVGALDAYAVKLNGGPLDAAGAVVVALALSCPVDLPQSLRTLIDVNFEVLVRLGIGSRKVIVPETRYLTTAINYTNGPPHIGHAYEAITTDVIARFARVSGSDTLFCTGTDEHGQKIAMSAEAKGMTPKEMCDVYAQAYQDLNAKLNISNDIYIRTTDPDHKATAQKLWRRCASNGDIYLGNYSGWYNVREETFVTEMNAKESDYKDPVSGIPLKMVKEESYFFRLKKYAPALKELYTKHPHLIQPEQYRQAIMAQLDCDVEDLSISRTSFSWGIPVPEDERHVMYVWFDALSNYISALGYLAETPIFSKFWPGEHIIGKDIIRFHCIIWPAMLISAKLPTPKSVVVHGFISAPDGRKMSKSLNNVVDPWEIVAKYPIDTMRYFSCFGAHYGFDLKFDLNAMEDMHNAHLADLLGNLLGRTSALIGKNCNGVIPCITTSSESPFNFESLRGDVSEAMNRYELQVALELILDASRATNKYLTDNAPWAIKDDPERQQQVIRITCEALYILAHFYSPFIPNSAAAIFGRLNHKPRTLDKLSRWFDNLTPGTEILKGDVLFSKFQRKPEVKAKPESKASKAKV